MEKALSLKEVEHTIRIKLKYKPIDAIILTFAPYHGDQDSTEAAYLRAWDDFDSHSGEFIDLFNVGYSRYGDSHPMERKLDVSTLWNGTTGFFYPSLFHDIRRSISSRLRGAWDYEGGIDFLFFSVNLTNAHAPIDWSRTVALRSKNLVPKVFPDVNALLRCVLNLAERRNGRFEPDDFRGEIGRRRFANRLKTIGIDLGPKLLELAPKIFLGK